MAEKTPNVTLDGGGADDGAEVDRFVLVSKAFSPAAPITSRDLFSGRLEQMQQLLDVAAQTGQHAVIYGERGVGKTSLAKVVAKILESEDSYTTVYTCSSGDTFSSIWRRVIGDLRFTVRTPGFGFGSVPEETIVSAEHLLGDGDVAPEDVRRAFTLLTSAIRIVLFIDEFDRLNAAESATLFADTIKILSDQLVDVTIVPVGVADSLDDLIAEHASIQRALAQIEMPKMNEEELSQIIERGVAAAEMSASDDLIDDIVQLSQGLPHYTHLITQNACRVALEDDERVNVTQSDLNPAIHRSLEGVSQSIRSTYHRATQSNRETLYRQVLSACAQTEKDELNSFSAADVREPLRRITGTQYDIPSFVGHLNAFSTPTNRRGGVLEKKGESRRFRYRFVDPLMPPYVVMRGRIDDDSP